MLEVWRVRADDYSLTLQCIDRKKMYEHLREQVHIFMLDDGLSKATSGVTTLDELCDPGGLSALQSEYEHIHRLLVE